ncbi:MAG: hypothetical protein NC912_00410 [Candidatus Omnitrophica bacterium]|nr:hypothetical protein [Candidatus Omnitrophota bacterium]
MRKICKYVMLGLFLGLLLKEISLASDIKKADELFDKGIFQEALKEYELVFNKEATDTEIRWKAFFRICESLIHLFRYGEAAEKLISTPVPQTMPHRAHILILKAEILRNFLMRYSSLLRGNVIDGEEGSVFRLTPDEIKGEIRKAYKQLWELRNELVMMDIRKEEYFLDIKDIDFGMYPTLFDYLILSWTNFLLNVEAPNLSEGAFKPKADLLLVEEFKQSVNLDDSPALTAAQLLEEANRFSQKGRFEAAERWKIKRILLPLKYPNLFDLRELTEDKTLYEDKDLQEYKERAKNILLKWMEKFKTSEAKAEAGYETAVILKDANKLAEAVRLCEKIERDFPGTHGSRYAEALRLKIQIPQLSLKAKTVMPPANDAFTITTKNLKSVYFRIYQVTPEELKDEFISFRAKEYGSAYE